MKTPATQPVACPSLRVIRTLPVLALLLAVLVSGCSTFNRDWDRAAGQLPPVDSITGRWEGDWTSEVNGHTGRLRCLMTRESDAGYRAQFRATYWKIFRFSYAVTLSVDGRDGAWLISGEENLGKMAGGAYRYEGLVSPTNFHATYSSKYDRGIFEMKRPE